MKLTPGTRFGPYEIVAEIGAGGMGVVYRARDGRLGREVAIKVLPAAVAADPDRLARFEQEARAAAALAHPNILAVSDIGWQSDDLSDRPGARPAAPYIVSELLDGESLRDRLSAGPVPVRKAVDYVLSSGAATVGGWAGWSVGPAIIILTTAIVAARRVDDPDTEERRAVARRPEEMVAGGAAAQLGSGALVASPARQRCAIAAATLVPVATSTAFHRYSGTVGGARCPEERGTIRGGAVLAARQAPGTSGRSPDTAANERSRCDGPWHRPSPLRLRRHGRQPRGSEPGRPPAHRGSRRL